MDEQDDKQAADQIEIGNIGDKAAVAAGRGAKAVQIGQLQIDLRLLPVVLILLVVIALMAYRLWPKSPEKMSGEFNVAVAEFAVLDQAGSTVRSGDGKEFGTFLYGRLEGDFAGLGLEFPYEIWPPEFTGRIPGATETERALAAEERAQKIDADVLVYGVISPSEDGSQVRPEFYINYLGFEQADEIVGQHNLGRPVRIELPFDRTQFQGVDNPALTARTKALAQITIGLSYYATDNMEKAAEKFTEAEGTEGWLSNAGKEVVYLFLGNTAGRLASRDKDSSYLIDARTAYETALAINPDYARAILGLGGVLYLESFGDPQDQNFGAVDMDILDRAETTFLEALQADAPESANIPAKVNFGLGQIYLIRAQFQAGDWIDRARDEFEQALAAYEAGDDRLSDLAGHAYARLGLIARLEGDLDTAIQQYARAAELVTPYWRGYYTALIGDIRAASGQPELSREAYEEAVRIAEQFGDQESAEEYLAKLRALEAGEVPADIQN